MSIEATDRSEYLQDDNAEAKTGYSAHTFLPINVSLAGVLRGESDFRSHVDVRAGPTRLRPK